MALDIYCRLGEEVLLWLLPSFLFSSSNHPPAIYGRPHQGRSVYHLLVSIPSIHSSNTYQRTHTSNHPFSLPPSPFPLSRPASNRQSSSYPTLRSFVLPSFLYQLQLLLPSSSSNGYYASSGMASPTSLLLAPPPPPLHRPPPSSHGNDGEEAAHKPRRL